MKENRNITTKEKGEEPIYSLPFKVVNGGKKNNRAF